MRLLRGCDLWLTLEMDLDNQRVLTINPCLHAFGVHFSACCFHGRSHCQGCSLESLRCWNHLDGRHAAAAAKSLQSCPTLCDSIDSSPPGSPSLGLSRQEHWSGLPFPSPMHESEKWKWSHSVMSDSLRPHGLPGSPIHGIFQARVLEWGAIAFSGTVS